ncbi:MAG: hypothetical protein ACLR56_09640 [Oscillospiraceae bacterium]
MSYEDILTENIKKEYTVFRKEQLSQNTETVFENAGKIHFYKNLYCYAVNSNLKTEFGLRDLKVLASHTYSLVVIDEYLSNEFLSIGGWEYIRQIFNAFLERENVGKIA